MLLDIKKVNDTKSFSQYLNAVSCKSKHHLPLLQEVIRKHAEALLKGGGQVQITGAIARGSNY